MLSSEYALALYEHSIKQNKLGSIIEEFSSLVDVLENENDLIKLFSHPKVSKNEKKEMLKNILVSFEDVFLHFCYVLVDNGRFDSILDIHEEFIKYIRKSKNLMVVVAYSVSTLSTDQLKAITDLLALKFKKNIEIINRIDEDLIDGIRLEFEGKVLDDTLRTNLDNLKSNLM